MTAKPPQPDSDPLSDLVLDFFRQLERGEVPDVDSFCDQYAAPVAGEARERMEMLLSTDATPAERRPEGQLVGSQLGDYRLLREIGRGGMGVVYLAWQSSLKRRVAVKVLPRERAASPIALERFQREATHAARLQHPGIVGIHTVGTSGGIHYFAMDFVDGFDLADALSKARASLRSETSPPSDLRLTSRGAASYIAEIAQIGAEVGDALHFAHGAGVIHRDVKPRNILLDAAGRARLADFGLARHLDDGTISQTGELGGTPFYMSPEQVRAQRSGIDHRTDVYSLGVVLYEALALRRPFEGSTSQEVLSQIAAREPKALRELNPRVPVDLETLVMKAMEKDPDQRYATAEALARDLRHFLAHEPIEARRPGPIARMRKLVRRNPAASGVLAASAAAIALAWPVATATARAQAREQALAPLRSALAAPGGLSALPLDAVAEIAARARSASAELSLSNGERELVEQIRGEARALAAAVRAEEKVKLKKALEAADADPAVDDWYTPLSRLREASALVPDDASAAAEASLEHHLPSVRIAADLARETVEVSRLEVSTGRWLRGRRLTTAAELTMRWPLGIYRFVVRGPGGFAEVVRTLDRLGETLEIQPVLRPTADATRGMRRIPPSIFLFGSAVADHPIALLAGRREERLDGFWIDEREVSAGEYRQFLLQTGRKPPSAWPAAWEPKWDSLPATFVSYEDARAYAEWAGKRLPTALEWERAMRGTAGAEWPSADAAARPEEVLNLGRGDGRAGGFASQWSEYIAEAWPVAGVPEGASADGLVHGLGNASEWTDSVMSRRIAGRLSVDRFWRITKGGSWRSSREFRLSDGGFAPIDLQTFDVGFRCAKSVIE
ncbi:MAG: protein kinase [Planctomycetes bacterium]|nr:protein kinase [Planctomycetota bacterium]